MEIFSVPNYYDEDGAFQLPIPLGEVPNMHLPNGLLNVSSCKFNAAAYVSFPHFYMADPILLDQFHPDSELFPNEEEHGSHITILPKQGIPLEVAIRMQINVLYRPITPYIPLLEGREPVFYPAIWFEVIKIWYRQLPWYKSIFYISSRVLIKGQNHGNYSFSFTIFHFSYTISIAQILYLYPWYDFKSVVEEFNCYCCELKIEKYIFRWYQSFQMTWLTNLECWNGFQGLEILLVESALDLEL